MSGPDDQSFVHKVRDETQRYMQDLRREAAEQRQALADCREERERLETQADQSAVELNRLNRQLERERQEKEAVLRRLAGVEEESRQAQDRFYEVERRNNDLASLYVASYQLHGSLDPEEILSTVREILINLVGTEEFAVFWREPGKALELLTSFGLESPPADPGEDSRIAETLENGDILFDAEGSQGSHAAPLAAAIPLHLGDTVRGIVAVYRILPQKEGRFGELDRELCALLSRQAAIAIHTTRASRGEGAVAHA